MSTLSDLRNEIKNYVNPEKAKLLQRFFKTAKGGYAEGDVFIGLTVPQSREIAGKFVDLPLVDMEQLLQSEIHEERLIALVILIQQFVKGNETERKEIYEFYLANTKYVNNWNLVDLSADKIVGAYLIHKKDRLMLYQLAKSENLWEKRISMVATFAFILQGEYNPTFRVAEILLHDKHDLIQKAVGWMLREVGKRCSEEIEEEFLQKHYKKMPRTMLRYAIERFPKEKRRRYLEGLV